MEIKMTGREFPMWCKKNNVPVEKMRSMIESGKVKLCYDLNGDGTGPMGAIADSDYLMAVAARYSSVS